MPIYELSPVVHIFLVLISSRRFLAQVKMLLDTFRAWNFTSHFGRCGGDEKANDHAEPTKSWMLKKHTQKTLLISPSCKCFFMQGKWKR